MLQNSELLHDLTQFPGKLADFYVPCFLSK